MTKQKIFRVDEVVAKDFEVLCALLGIPQRQAGELALRQWIQRNRCQVSLEAWTEARGAAAPANTALIKIQLTILKADLRDMLGALKDVSVEYRTEILRKVRKMIPTAQALVQETGDQELKGTLAAIVEKVPP